MHNAAIWIFCIRIMANICSFLKQRKEHSLFEHSRILWFQHKPFCTKLLRMRVCDLWAQNDSTHFAMKSAIISQLLRENFVESHTRGSKRGHVGEHTGDSTFTRVPITLGAESNLNYLCFIEKTWKTIFGLCCRKIILVQEGKHFFYGTLWLLLT